MNLTNVLGLFLQCTALSFTYKIQIFQTNKRYLHCTVKNWQLQDNVYVTNTITLFVFTTRESFRSKLLTDRLFRLFS